LIVRDWHVDVDEAWGKIIGGGEAGGVADMEVLIEDDCADGTTAEARLADPVLASSAPLTAATRSTSMRHAGLQIPPLKRPMPSIARGHPRWLMRGLAVAKGEGADSYGPEPRRSKKIRPGL
jgi:hypothetical protein